MLYTTDSPAVMPVNCNIIEALIVRGADTVEMLSPSTDTPNMDMRRKWNTSTIVWIVSL